MIQNAIEITDENALNAEKLEGDDVAQIRTKVLDKVDVQEFKASSNDSNNNKSNEMNVSYSYVCPRPEQVLNTKLSKERNDIASMRIKGIANAFNIKLIEENNNNTDDEKKNMTAMMKIIVKVKIIKMKRMIKMKKSGSLVERMNL